MLNSFRHVSFLFLLFLFSTMVTAAPKLSGDDDGVALKPATDPIEIRLVTFSPYHEIFTWFGHSAIEVRNVKTGKAHMFNFGGFYFDTEHLLQLVFGRFLYFSFFSETEQALIPYENEGRQMVFQTLNLTSLQQSRIIRQLLDYQKPANRFYIYDFFLDNCSTKIRDIIDQALDGNLKKQASTPVDLTFRDYVHRMTYNAAYLDFVIMFILNDTVDKPITHWDSMFIPDRLMAVIQTSHNSIDNGLTFHPLVRNHTERNIGPGLPYFTPKAMAINTVTRELIWGFFLLAIIGLSAIFYIKNHRFFRKLYPGIISVFGLVFGTLGLILFFMMCFTEHKDTFWNENILLLNPLTLLLFPTGILAVVGKFRYAFSWISIGTGLTAMSAIVLKTLPLFDQVNGQQLRTLLPALLVIGITGIIEVRKSHRL